MEISQAPESAASERRALLCLLGMWSLGWFAVVFPELDYHWSYGVLYAGIGLLALLFPPQVALPRWFYVGGGLLLLGALAALLPAEWLGKPAWRMQVEALGLNTGTQVTTIPLQTLAQVGSLVVGLLATMLVLGHRVSDGKALWLLWLFSAGVAISSGWAVVAEQTGWKPFWDVDPSFGFFPNRNHTATLLVMGNLSALAALFSAIRNRRHGIAGLAAVTLAICLGATLGFSASRAGLLLTVLLTLVWLLGLGTRYISRRVVVVMLAAGVITAGLFFLGGSDLKMRLSKTSVELQEAEHGVEVKGELRVQIYQDTLEMMRHEPWTGVGMGCFQYVFPQYRVKSATAASSVHPESDWLMVAAEMGWPTAVLLAVGVAGLLRLGFQSAHHRPAWPLRWGGLMAAATVPLHGIFDVPGHRIGLVLGAIWLLSLALRRSSAPPSDRAWARWMFRAAGAVVFINGVWLIVAALGRAAPASFARAERHQQEVLRLVAEDTAERQAAKPNVATGEDKLEIALRVIDQAIAEQPLEAGRHFAKGVLALNFTDMLDIVEKEFAIQRVLSPRFVQVPLQQAHAASLAHPKLTETLWQEALRRADVMQELAPGTELTRRQVLERIAQQASLSAVVARAALPLLAEAPEHYRQWAWQAPAAQLDELLPGLLSASKLSPEVKTDLLRAWKVRGDPAQAAAYQAAHP